ncbi:MAG: FecCD family ABC transporter permease [bacterium]
MVGNKKLVYLTLLLSPLVVGMVALFFGAYFISPVKIFDILSGKLTGSSNHLNPQESSIIIDIRLPRILLSCLVGMALSLSGAVMQGVFRNPLVDPYILGVSAGAAFGCSLGVGFIPKIPIQFISFLFALAAVLLSYSIARTAGGVGLSSLVLVLSGVVVSALFSALVSLIKFLVDPHKLQSIVFWLMGSFSIADWKGVKLATIGIIPFSLPLLLMSWRLNLLSLPEEEALSLGVNVKRERFVFLSLATFIVAVAVSLSGIIGWIGLIVPHLVRMLVGPNHKRLLLLSMSSGGSFMIFADTLARNVSQFDIPVGVITAVLGAPFFIYLLKKGGGQQWESQ